MPNYTVFQHKTRPELHCAIPESHTLPDSVEPDMWEECSLISGEGAAPQGFEESAARYALSVQGFYIFRQRTHSQAVARLVGETYQA